MNDLGSKLKLLNGRKETPDIPGQYEDEEVEVNPTRCYATVRGQRDRAKAIEFRWLDGRTLSIDWAWMPFVVYQAGTIVLVYGNFKITLKGRGLDRMAQRLGERVVVWVSMMVKEHDAGEKDAECVYSMEVAKLEEGEEMKLLTGK